MSGAPVDDATAMLRLVEAAQRALALQPCRLPGWIDEVCADVRRAVDRPCDSERVIFEEAHLFALAVAASDRALAMYDKERARRINRMIAALLPDMQECGYRALILRNEARPTP